MMKIFKNSPKPLALAVMLATGASQINAQGLMLEEIVVTAQKRTESLQDVPISVSAVDGSKIAEAGIENLQDLSAYVPNLKIVEGGLVPQIFVRGIGSSANQGFEQSVGTYSDGIYMGRSLQSRSSFMDLERVEVLRGPQSILFGQSSIAGAISLVSAKPTNEFEGMVSASHAPEFDQTEVNAYVSGPLTETLSARLAVRDLQDDGYVTNKLKNTDSPVLDEQAARLSLAWDAADDLSVIFKAEVSDLKRDGRQTQVLDLGTYAARSPVALQDDAVLDYNTYANEDINMSFESENYVLELEYGLWGDNTLTAITGYSEYDYREDNYDGDNSELSVVSMDLSEKFEQFSQEIRLTSPGGETLDYIVGAFYQTSEQRYNEDVDIRLSSLGSSAILDSTITRPFSQDSDSLAAFGQVTWNMADDLRATLGVRYAEDEKSASRTQDIYSLAYAPGVLQSDVIFPAGPFTGFPVGTALALTAPLGYSMADHELSDQQKNKNWTPSFNLQYDWNEDVMLYLTFSEGYKAAGFDARGINGFTATDTDALGRSYSTLALGDDNFNFNQEEAETIELGVKASLLDGAAELNAAFFQTDYTDMQVSVYDGSFGFSVLNAGAATVRGLEMDGRWQATESLMFAGAMAYLDFEWTDFQEGSCPGQGVTTPSPSGSGNCVYDGLENNHTPEWTVNISANHVYSLNDSLELRSTLDANFKDNHYVANNLDPRSEQAATTIVNGRLTVASVDDTWQVALTAKNLTNRLTMNYATNLAQSGGGMTAQVGRPRTLAIEGSYSF